MLFRIALTLLLVTFIVNASSISTQGKGDRGFDIEKLADGVYAVMRREPAGLAVHANNVFIVNDDDVVVVDTSQSLALTKDIIAALRKITTKPVKFVINTHWHDDHYIGNQVYRDAFPGVEFIAHAATLTDYPTDGVPNRQQMKAGIPPLLARVKDLLKQNKNLAGQDLTVEERAAFESDIEWAERYLQEVPTADVILPTLAVTDRLTLTRAHATNRDRSVGPGSQPGRSHRPPPRRQHRRRRRSRDLAGTSRRVEVVDWRLGDRAAAHPRSEAGQDRTRPRSV